MPIPRLLCRRGMHAAAGHARASLAFMSAGHHKVRDCVVLEPARKGTSLPTSHVADTLSMDLARVNELVRELERRKTFLFRSDGVNVARGIARDGRRDSAPWAVRYR